MADHTIEGITISLPDHVEITAMAGKLSAQEIRRMPKARKSDVGIFCKRLADIIDTGTELIVPEGLAAEMRAAGAKAEDIKPHILKLKYILKVLQQQSLLYDFKADDLVRQLNDLYNAQSKRNSKLRYDFIPLLYYFNKGKPPDEPVPDADSTNANTANQDINSQNTGK